MVTKIDLAKTRLAKYKQEVDVFLDKYTANLLEEYQSIDKSKIMLEIAREYVLRGGKRVRASLVIGGYELVVNSSYGKKEISRSELVKVAAAVELVHAYLLILDDIADASDLRRGRKTVHKLYYDVYEENRTKPNLNMATAFAHGLAAITAAYVQHLASNLILETSLTPELKTKVLRTLNDTVITTAYGEVADIINGIKNSVSEQDVLEVLELKTGVYTYLNPLQIGATLGGANSEFLRKIQQHAIPAGIAFQIQDDVLGTFGEVDETGKSNKDDLIEGKMTLLTSYALNNVSTQDKNTLIGIMNNPDISDDQFKTAQKIITDSGALSHSQETAQKLVADSIAELSIWRDELDLNDSTIDFLEGIALYMIDRKV